MTQIQSSADILEIVNREQALLFIQSVINTPYPLAIWRLPNTETIYALVDITSEEKRYVKDLEEVSRAFFVNCYDDNHPIHPLALNGDILITINHENAEAEISPTLTSTDLERFFETISNGKFKKQRKISDCHSNHPDYEQMVAEAVDKIKGGAISKVVLSRFKDFDLREDFNPILFFEQLTQNYINAFCYFLQTETYGTWMGATPEKLIAIEKDQFFSTVALAGTQLLKEGQVLCDIAWTQKEIEEQAMVSRYIINCFKKIRLREFEEIGPKTVKAGALVHLKTEFKVDMQATNSPQLGSTMLELLHPTSAVCGHPRDLANEFIKSHEAYPRELYAGFLGPVGINGDTRLFVNLRCMQLYTNKARLYAGAGITEDSIPEKELIETENKMQTLLKVLS